MPICTLCDLDKPLIKAHLIPKNYFFGIRKTDKHLISLTIGDCLKKKQSQNGIYDKSILCGDCDRKIGVFDTYAYKVFPVKPDLARTQEGLAYQFPGLDFHRLNKFIFSLLWRFHVSELPLAHYVELDPELSAQIKSNLRQNTKQGFELISYFAVLMLHQKHPRLIQQPTPVEYAGVKCYAFHLAPWKLIIKLNQQPFPGSLEAIKLHPEKPPYALIQYGSTDAEKLFMEAFQERVRRATEM